MGIYKVEIREGREFEATYWVEAENLDEARELAEAGETACEVRGPEHGVCYRHVHFTPVKVESVPLDVLASEIDDDKQAELDELIHEMKSEEATELNNCGPEKQVKYLVEQMGIEGATKAVRNL